MNETVKKIAFLFAAIAGGYTLLYRPAKEVASEYAPSVPWYLTYNYPPGFTAGGMSLLPSSLIGQANAAINPGAACDSCSLFPTVNSGRL